jgi:hypothetical protein
MCSFNTLLVCSFEILFQGNELWARLLQLVNRNRIRHCLNQTPICACGDDVERLEPEFKAVLNKDVFELGYHLRSKLFLLQIVPTFYNAADQTKALFIFQPSETALLCDFKADFVE